MPPRLPRLAASLGLALALVTGMLAAAPPAPVMTATADTMEASLLTWINRDRAARGLRPLYRDGRLADLAGDRAAALARLNVLSHTAPGDLRSQLDARNIQRYRYGENIAYTSKTWGAVSAAELYRLWKGSPGHWAMMMSERMNYLGIGVAPRAENGRTFGAIVFTESNDHTKPAAKITGAVRSGRTVTWTWSAWDRQLQTHTAGLRDVDVQYRTGSGTWRTIRNDTTATRLTLTDRTRGTVVSIRVRARDRVGLLSTWTAEWRVAIP